MAMKTAKKYNPDLILHGNLIRAILSLAIPVVINSFLQTMYNLTDTYWLGKIGTEQLAAINLGFRKLDNLCVMVDNNNLQIDGPIDQVCSPYPIDKKFEAFNFHVINADAHDFDAIRAAFKEARETKGMPTCIVFHSLKGKGVSFMENSVDWHGKAPNDEEYAVAMADLDKIEKELEKAGEQ